MEKKKLKITFNAKVILVFSLLCFIATVIGIATNGAGTKLLFSTWHSSLANPLTYVRLFTHVIGHEDWDHFINNISFILLLGPMLEEKYGSKAIIEIILITGFITGVIMYVFFPSTMLLGASGVVFAFIILSSFAGFQDGEIPLTFILIMIIYVGQQVLQGIMMDDNVSQLGHILGGLVGAVAGYLLNKKKIKSY